MNCTINATKIDLPKNLAAVIAPQVLGEITSLQGRLEGLSHVAIDGQIEYKIHEETTSTRGFIKTYCPEAVIVIVQEIAYVNRLLQGLTLQYPEIRFQILAQYTIAWK